MHDTMTWMGISKEDLVKGVAKRQEVALHLATPMAEKILRFDEALREPFQFYWKTGEIPEVQAHHGYTLRNLMTGEKRTPRFRPIGAFLALDWIIREPEQAIDALHRPVYYLGDPPHVTADAAHRMRDSNS